MRRVCLNCLVDSNFGRIILDGGMVCFISWHLFFVTFFVRALVGGTLIFFINHYVLLDQTSLNVGINAASLVTSGALGVPGVCLLYGILIFQNCEDFTKTKKMKNLSGQIKNTRL